MVGGGPGVGVGGLDELRHLAPEIDLIAQIERQFGRRRQVVRGGRTGHRRIGARNRRVERDLRIVLAGHLTGGRTGFGDTGHRGLEVRVVAQGRLLQASEIRIVEETPPVGRQDRRGGILRVW